jgi:hypothetical protein
MKSQALAPQTGRIIEAISQLECIKPFVLVGGTAVHTTENASERGLGLYAMERKQGRYSGYCLAKDTERTRDH